MLLTIQSILQKQQNPFKGLKYIKLSHQVMSLEHFTGEIFSQYLFTEKEEVEIRKTIESYYVDIWLCLDRIWYFQKPCAYMC